MTSGVLLIGASGLAREVLAAGIRGVAGILDDDEALHGTEIDGVRVLGSVADAANREESLLACVGSGAGRRTIVDRLRQAGVDESRYATFAADSARIGRSSDVGSGSILLEGVVVTAHASVGHHVVVMPNCTITHDDEIGDFATLAAGVSLGGTVRIGEAAYVGMNACVREGLSVGADATIGMGAVVLADVPNAQTWAGVPAAPLRGGGLR
ncbi:NeuD/PglB/VioB family sugar acetyltransferase [Microbacterium yannicii]|uniref:NeuD/PglB/VioB family sugar acetyltransferase n=1 Tax=Microbacterium yannicii TaxID=671622 RepID=UPI0002DDE38F|nr:NeuD/PglB/VioB family sugar acetyltransferase [Microbacterium yannicii]